MFSILNGKSYVFCVEVDGGSRLNARARNRKIALRLRRGRIGNGHSIVEAAGPRGDGTLLLFITVRRVTRKQRMTFAHWLALSFQNRTVECWEPRPAGSISAPLRRAQPFPRVGSQEPRSAP